MADVCIICARGDARKPVTALARLLSERWSIWWDAKINEGDYRRAIKLALAAAGCVVPIWSRDAEFSKTLFDELTFCEENGIPILPIRIHNVDPPLGFGANQRTDAIGWIGQLPHPAISEHIDKIEQALKRRKAPKNRIESLSLGNSPRLPAFFYSISSHQTRLVPEVALETLQLFRVGPILMSAFDMEKDRRTKKLRSALSAHRKNGGFILLDSGMYEKDRLGDERWTVDAFHEALDVTPHDMTFCYDDQKPSARVSSSTKSVIAAVERDAKHTKAPVLPIVHLPKDSNGDYRVDLAPELVVEVSKELQPPLIAIPERELGRGVFDRTKAMVNIRQALHELFFYQPIHILGTGNPVTIALLTAAGADSFDGLEWCRYVADGRSRTLHHFQLYELFKWQDDYSSSEVMLAAAKDDNIRYTGKAILHNLDFYTSWVERLRVAARQPRRMIEFVTQLIPDEAMDLARASLPEVL